MSLSRRTWFIVLEDLRLENCIKSFKVLSVKGFSRTIDEIDFICFYAWYALTVVTVSFCY